MLVASALFMAAVHDFENVVTAVSDVSCNIVQLHYALFFLGGGDSCRGRTIRTSGNYDTFKGRYKRFLLEQNVA